MKVIRDAADFVRVSAHATDGASDISEEAATPFLGNPRLAVLRGEYEMVMKRGVCVGHEWNGWQRYAMLGVGRMIRGVSLCSTPRYRLRWLRHQEQSVVLQVPLASPADLERSASDAKRRSMLMIGLDIDPRRAIGNRVGWSVIDGAAVAGVDVIKSAITGRKNGALADDRALDTLTTCVAWRVNLGDG